MNITVALNGSLERNLKIAPGDDVTLNLTVYTADGDTSPVVVTNAAMATGRDLTLPVGTQFTVDCESGRMPYRIAGDIAGVTKTLAYGVIEYQFPFLCRMVCRCDYAE